MQYFGEKLYSGVLSLKHLCFVKKATEKGANNTLTTENNNPATHEEDTIDLLDLARVLWKKIWLILLALVIGAVAVGTFSKFMITPQYQASSMIYVYSKSTSITSLTDLQIGSQLAVDFQIVATTREVINKVITKLNLNTTYEELLDSVSVSSPSGSHILVIKVTDPDPVKAAQISNTLADELRMRIADVMNTDAPSMVDRAVVPAKQFSPSVKKNALLGGLGAAVVAAAIIIVLHLLDDTIKNEDDISRYLGINVLAEIPLESTGKKKKRRAT